MIIIWDPCRNEPYGKEEWILLMPQNHYDIFYDQINKNAVRKHIDFAFGRLYFV